MADNAAQGARLGRLNPETALPGAVAVGMDSQEVEQDENRQSCYHRGEPGVSEGIISLEELWHWSCTPCEPVLDPASC